MRASAAPANLLPTVRLAHLPDR